MSKRAQSTLEYVVLAAVITGALIAMQVYIKRGLQGNIRQQASQLSEGYFYSPGATNAEHISTTNLLEVVRGEDNFTYTNIDMNQETNKTEEIASFSDEPGRW